MVTKASTSPLEASEDTSSRPIGWRPVPDPTELTTRQLMAAVAALRELIEARLNAADKATDLRLQEVEKIHLEVRRESEKIIELAKALLSTEVAKLDGALSKHIGETIEKFGAVAAQFSERDTRTDQRAGDTKLAVDAAFAAAKEATAKIEAGFTKQIDGQAILIDSKAKTAEDRLSDLKDRITILESRSSVIDPTVADAVAEMRAFRMVQNGTNNQQSGQSAGHNDAWQSIGVIIAIAISVGILIVEALALHH